MEASGDKESKDGGGKTAVRGKGRKGKKVAGEAIEEVEVKNGVEESDESMDQDGDTAATKMMRISKNPKAAAKSDGGGNYFSLDL